MSSMPRVGRRPVPSYPEVMQNPVQAAAAEPYAAAPTEWSVSDNVTSFGNQAELPAIFAPAGPDVLAPAAAAPNARASVGANDSLAQIQAEFAQFQARLAALGASPSDLTGAGAPVETIEMTQTHEPQPQRAMRVPSPVHMNRVPDQYIVGADQNYLVNNAMVHVRHNQQVEAQHAVNLEMLQSAPAGTKMVWWSHEFMPYTAEVRRIGVSEADFRAFWKECDKIKAYGREHIFSLVDTICTVMGCGMMACCDPQNAFSTERWEDEYTARRMQDWAQTQNNALAAKGVHACFRANYVSGMGFKLELHRLG